jgi:hypothetical protein
MIGAQYIGLDVHQATISVLSEVGSYRKLGLWLSHARVRTLFRLGRESFLLSLLVNLAMRQSLMKDYSTARRPCGRWGESTLNRSR